jgi:hypothetical protein
MFDKETLKSVVKYFYQETKNFSRVQFLRFFTYLINKKAFNQSVFLRMKSLGWRALFGADRVDDIKEANRR